MELLSRSGASFQGSHAKTGQAILSDRHGSCTLPILGQFLGGRITLRSSDHKASTIVFTRAGGVGVSPCMKGGRGILATTTSRVRTIRILRLFSVSRLIHQCDGGLRNAGPCTRAWAACMDRHGQLVQRQPCRWCLGHTESAFTVRLPIAPLLTDSSKFVTAASSASLLRGLARRKAT